MISNKIVTIIKENQFNKGWTIFSPVSFEIERNWAFKKVELSNIIKAITFSTMVNLVLSEACLPLRIINELEWTNKYTKINLIAKNKKVVDRYKNLSFNSCKIDETVNVNYIGIKGKVNGFYLLGNDLCEVDESIENFYFNNTKDNGKYLFLEKAKSIIICNSGRHRDFNDFLSLANKYGIFCYYVISDKYFDREAYDYAKNNKIDLFVSDYVDDVVLVVKKDNSIFKMSTFDNELVFFYPIDRVNRYIGELYKNLFIKDIIEVDNIPSNVYSCFNGKNEKLNITDTYVIKKDVNINEMSDFISETFDKSIIEKHNDYSNKARRTQYLFTLTPPLFNSSYLESSIYNPIHKLYSEWMNINKIKFDRVVKDYHEFMNEDSKLIPFISYSHRFSNKLEQMITNCSYSGYYHSLNEAIHIFEEYQNYLFNDFSFMFNAVSLESSSLKFNKFDTEIERYKKTIKEKETLVFAGIDVLENKRRIEMLNKKIKDLLVLKNKFESSSVSRLDKEASSFALYCKNLVKDISSTTIDSDSIEKIVSANEKSKLTKLYNFATNYLKQINDYLIKSINCLKNMKGIRIPEEYPVFEKEKQRYIVLNDLSEYESSKAIREEFFLKCLARR